MISELASMPIGNQEIPLSFAIVPILIIISLEVIISFCSTRSSVMKRIFLGSPSILIQRGKVKQKELSKARMSMEELLSQLRQNGVTTVEDADYAILENNGKLSVIPRAAQPVTTKDLNLQVGESGIAHAIIIDGTVKRRRCAAPGKAKSGWRKKSANPSSRKKNFSYVGGRSRQSVYYKKGVIY